MTAILRMGAFHLRIFAKNGYFVQLLITSTMSVLVLQLLVAHALDNEEPTSMWLRAGMVGTWSVATVAAGMIGYQRFQGTLVHLVATPRSAATVLLPLVGSGATFGLLAFPLAAAVSAAFGFPAGSEASWPGVALGIATFWAACLAISCVVAALFVLTPNAITYEGLLVVPLILVSGVFGVPANLPGPLVAVTYALPTTAPVRLMTEPMQPISTMPILAAAVVLTAAWFLAARWLLGRALRRSMVAGTLEVI